MQRWRPDTCVPPYCALVTEGANEVQNFRYAEQLCPVHATPQAAFVDGFLKRDAVQKLAELLRGLDPAILSDEIGWSFDAQRRLLVEIPPRLATAAQPLRGTIQTELGRLNARVVLV